jgi:hypothetical protein
MLATSIRPESARVLSDGGRPAPQANLTPQDLPAMWASLVEDASSGVDIISASGTVLFANEYSTWFHTKGTSISSLAGHSLREFLPEAMATERLRIIQEVCSGGKPIALDGMVRGKLVRTVYRPLPQRTGGGACVLAVTRVCTEQASNRLGSRQVAVRTAKHHDHGELGKLTARELEILRLIGIGLSTSEIAEKLGRSVKTVEWHRVALGEKLGITNRVELARIAIAAGIVWLDTDTLPNEAGADEAA